MDEDSQEIEIINASKNEEPRISHEPFCKLFDNHSKFDNFFVIDCRSAREYNGGHIKGAIRYHPLEKNVTIADFYKKIWKPKSIFIFHCEYSVFRGPIACQKFSMEHLISNNYKDPLQSYILDGGDRKFYSLHPDYCEGRYVPEDPWAK